MFSPIIPQSLVGFVANPSLFETTACSLSYPTTTQQALLSEVQKRLAAEVLETSPVRLLAATIKERRAGHEELAPIFKYLAASRLCAPEIYDRIIREVGRRVIGGGFLTFHSHLLPPRVKDDGLTPLETMALQALDRIALPSIDLCRTSPVPYVFPFGNDLSAGDLEEARESIVIGTAIYMLVLKKEGGMDEEWEPNSTNTELGQTLQLTQEWMRHFLRHLGLSLDLDRWLSGRIQCGTLYGEEGYCGFFKSPINAGAVMDDPSRDKRILYTLHQVMHAIKPVLYFVRRLQGSSAFLPGIKHRAGLALYENQFSPTILGTWLDEAMTELASLRALELVGKSTDFKMEKSDPYFVAATVMQKIIEKVSEQTGQSYAEMEREFLKASFNGDPDLYQMLLSVLGRKQFARFLTRTLKDDQTLVIRGGRLIGDPHQLIAEEIFGEAMEVETPEATTPEATTPTGRMLQFRPKHP